MSETLSFALAIRPSFRYRFRLARYPRRTGRKLGGERGFALGRSYSARSPRWLRTIERDPEHLVDVVGQVELHVLPRLGGQIVEIRLVLLREHDRMDARALG